MVTKRKSTSCLLHLWSKTFFFTMKSLSSLYRIKNVDFFMLIGSCDTVTEAGKKADICRDHARKLVKLWKEDGLIMVNEGSYIHTDAGLKHVNNFYSMGVVLRW